MSIRKHVQYNGKFVEGYVDIGAPEEEGDFLKDVASEALVFLVNSMEQRWKIPLAYFFTNALPADTKKELLINCIRKLQSIGVIVGSLTFDGLSSNIVMARKLACQQEINRIQPNFEVDGHQIHLFYDPCHMVKLVRNAFGEKKIFKDYKSRVISWQYIVKLHNLQEREELHLANKLRAKHIEFFRKK